MTSPIKHWACRWGGQCVFLGIPCTVTCNICSPILYVQQEFMSSMYMICVICVYIYIFICINIYIIYMYTYIHVIYIYIHIIFMYTFIIYIYIHITLIYIYIFIFTYIIYLYMFIFAPFLLVAFDFMTHDVSDINSSYCILNPACKVSNTSQAFLVFLVSGPHVDEWKSYGAFRDFYEEELEGGSTFLEEFDMKILDDFNMVDSEFCKSLLFRYVICSGFWNRFVSLDPIFVV